MQDLTVIRICEKFSMLLFCLVVLLVIVFIALESIFSVIYYTIKGAFESLVALYGIAKKTAFNK